MRLLLSSLLIFFLSQTLAFSQKNAFTGMLEYKITIRDTSMRALIPDNKMIVYTNDTITRIENFTDQLGKQVVIHHMVLNKSYMLLETPVGKFAIQTNNNVRDTVVREDAYTMTKKCGRTAIMGRKAKKLLVSYKDSETNLEFLYLKGYSNKYLNNFENSPGLLVKYSLPTEDGILDYELIRMNPYQPDRDLFGIPSDYERVSFDEFLKRILKSNGDEPDRN